jgi:diguanylate cyclase (GGDEF)-like protein
VVLYGVLLSLSVITHARIHTAGLVSEREAGRQGEFVGLLLRDFEEHAAELPWEIGRDGRFTRVSDRLATAMATRRDALHGTTLLEALAGHVPEHLFHPHLADLTRAFGEGRPFRDLVVPIQSADGLRWWSITAKPLAAGGWRGVIADVTAAREAHERLAQLAHFDSLTGLANRVQLRDHVRQALQEGQALALLCLDIDHFKSINDAFGHAVGDAVLVEVARRLRGGLRSVDLASRLGGDEFALVVQAAHSPEQLQAVADRLVRALGQPFEVNGHAVPLSASVGVAWAPAHGADLDELMANADLALYAAKEGGRGRYECFVPRLGDRHRRRVLIAQELHGALARGEFALAWQPQVHIATGQPVGAEVLLRWLHPELGAVSPAEFVPVAEESGQITAIGTWVLEQACAGAMALPDSVTVSVNASPAQLLRDDFLAGVALALARSRLPARRLKVEITESLFMDAVPVALANLHGLRELGVGIALDDFGTGYSSLAYLLRFPFDTLKIDRAFVLEMMARDDARALVRGIVEMARTMGMGTVAEGVEDAAQLEVLRQAGCDAVQGYLLARPMPLPALQEWLDARSHTPPAGPAESVHALSRVAVRNGPTGELIAEHLKLVEQGL